jgi:putative transposase
MSAKKIFVVAKTIALPMVSYAVYSFPPQAISYAVWLYIRFSLSFRMVGEVLYARSIDNTYEALCQCTLKFGHQTANRIRTRVSTFSDMWHLDDVVITNKSKYHWMRRAVDKSGYVLDALLQSRSNSQAAERLMRELLNKHNQTPQGMVTNELKSYAAANWKLGWDFESRQRKGLNNRAEYSHQLARVHEKVMRRYKSASHLQRYLSAPAQVGNQFMHCRDNHDAQQGRDLLRQAFAAWHKVTFAKMVVV